MKSLIPTCFIILVLCHQILAQNEQVNEQLKIIHEASLISKDFQGNVRKLFVEDNGYSFIGLRNIDRKTKYIIGKVDKTGQLIYQLQPDGIAGANSSIEKWNDNFLLLHSYGDAHRLLEVDTSGNVTRQKIFEANFYEGSNSILIQDTIATCFLTDTNPPHRLYSKTVDSEFDQVSQNEISDGFHSILHSQFLNNKVWLFTNELVNGKSIFNLFIIDSKNEVARLRFPEIKGYKVQVINDSTILVAGNNYISKLNIETSEVETVRLTNDQGKFRAQDLIINASNCFVLLKKSSELILVTLDKNSLKKKFTLPLYKTNSISRNQMTINQLGNLLIYGARFNPKKGESVRRENPYYVELELK